MTEPDDEPSGRVLPRAEDGTVGNSFGLQMTAPERMAELDADEFIKQAETLARLEYQGRAYEDVAVWWKLEKHVYLVEPRNASLRERLKALMRPTVLSVTRGEMVAAAYATKMVVAYTQLAMFAVQGVELDAFIRYSIQVYIERACTLLRPGSEDIESRQRIARMIDMGTTTELAALRALSYAQAALKDGADWENIARSLPPTPVDTYESESLEDIGPSELSSMAAALGISPAELRSAEATPGEAAAKRQAFMVPHLRKRTRAAIAKAAYIEPSSLYRWMDGKNRLSPDNLTKLAKALSVETATIPNK